MLYLIQRADAREFAFAPDIDPRYAEAFVRATAGELGGLARDGDGPAVSGRLTSDGGRAFMLLDAAIGDLA